MDTQTQTDSTKETQLNALLRFIRSRPGFDRANYDTNSAYRADTLQAARDKLAAEAMLARMRWASNVTLPDTKGQRLEWNGAKWDYTTGQYYCLEYRAAACRLLASAFWHAWRQEFDKGNVTAMHNSETGETVMRRDGLRASEWIAKQAKVEFGIGIARRWFS